MADFIISKAKFRTIQTRKNGNGKDGCRGIVIELQNHEGDSQLMNHVHRGLYCLQSYL